MADDPWDSPDWASSDRGSVQGFYNAQDWWVELKDGVWQYSDGVRANPPTESDLHLSDLITVSWTNGKGDTVYATISGGLDEDYPLDEAIHDLEERDSGTPS